MTLVKNWVTAFISLFVMSFIWHNVILTDFYTKNLSEIGRYTDGAVAPLLPYLALGVLLIALGFALFVPALSKTTKDYALNGFLAGLSITGSFAVLSHAIFTGWNTNLMFADASYGIISGILTALILMTVNKKTA